MKLADIEAGFDAVERLYEASQGEETPEIALLAEALGLAEKDKLDSYALYIKKLEGDAQTYQQLADELTAKRRAAIHRVEWLKQRVKDYLAFRGAPEISGSIYRFKLCKNGGKPPVEVLVAVEELPREWVTVTTTANKEAIRAYLEEHGEPSGPIMARFGEVGEHVRII